jgi:hypothetical protein
MEDHDFAQATTWAQMRAIHDRFFADYNLQPHWAHQHRKDGRRTPQAVLGPIHGVWCDEAELDRLFRLRAERVFDAGGYVRYKRWRTYGERGLARRRGTVWLFGEVLSVAFEDDTLAQYRMQYEPETRRIAELTDARLYETGQASPQPFLWDLGDLDWHLVRRLAPYRPRRRPTVIGVQAPLFPEATEDGAEVAQSDIMLIGDWVTDTTAHRWHPDERTQRQHRCERSARVVAISPATRHAPPDQPMGVPPPPRLWGHAYCRWQCRGRRGRRVPLVRRLRMGSLLPGSCGAESRGWLLVPHDRSPRICPILSLRYSHWPGGR